MDRQWQLLIISFCCTLCILKALWSTWKCSVNHFHVAFLFKRFKKASTNYTMPHSNLIFLISVLSNWEFHEKKTYLIHKNFMILCVPTVYTAFFDDSKEINLSWLHQYCQHPKAVKHMRQFMEIQISYCLIIHSHAWPRSLSFSYPIDHGTA